MVGTIAKLVVEYYISAIEYVISVSIVPENK